MPTLTPPTPEQLWNLCRHQPMKTVAEKYGTTVQDLVWQFRLAGLTGGGPKDPSPQEIEAAKRKIRESWDETTQQSRWVGVRGRALR